MNLNTDQFRINNASNFVNSVVNSTDSYYVFLGLPNPKEELFGRNNNWQTDDNITGIIPNPIDNQDYKTHYRDTILFGRRINESNIRRVVKKYTWSAGTRYDMYRHDYSILNPSPISNSSRLYDSNYYVINSDYRVYICLYNGSSGTNLQGNASQDEPNFIDFEPSKAGNSGDGYIWKYLFTVPPSDIIKFDSTEYIVLPNDWETSNDSQIASIRENANSYSNNNQIKVIYIEDPGSGYLPGGRTVDILGDGVGGKAYIEVNQSGSITSAIVTQGGKGYTYGIVDLSSIQSSSPNAKLIPIIPPSVGHGYNIYEELGADKVLVYSRFDDSTLDFPSNTKFSQIGIVKNPKNYILSETYQSGIFSSLYSIKINSFSGNVPNVGDKIEQQKTSSKAVGYVASYNTTTNVLKYFKDRSLYYSNGNDQSDSVGITSISNATIEFENGFSVRAITGNSGFIGQIDSNFTGITTTINNNILNLETQFTNGLANPEINSKTGDIIYIDNRPLVARNLRQKEDVKIILEF